MTGGGGGASTNGVDANATWNGVTGNGGDGVSNTFRDGSTSVEYGKGGQGGNPSLNYSTATNDGPANSGRGGWGAQNGNNDPGNGGSGILMIRYPDGTIDALWVIAYNSVTRDMPKDVNGSTEWQAVDSYLSDVLVFERRKSSATMK